MSALGTFEDFGSSQRERLPRHSLDSRQSSSINRPTSRAEHSEEYRPLAAARDDEPSDGSVAASDNQYQLQDLSEPPATTGILLRKAALPAPTNTPGINSTRASQKKDRGNVFWIWKEEILFLFAAAGLFAGICVILYMFNERELPNWDDLSITLNTLISILATLFRASLAIITFEILAQLKWDWISSGTFRPIQQVEVFDSASRGILGCVRLISIIAIQNPLALAAIFVAVSSIGIGSFTQQSVQTFQCRLPIHSPNLPATITTATYAEFSDFGAQSFYLAYSLNMKLKLAMKDAISSSREYNSLFSCSSGNCTFPTYSNDGGYSRSNQTSHASVGLCSRCSDIKTLVRGPEPLNPSENNTVVYSLPDFPDKDNRTKRMAIIHYPNFYGDNLVLNSRTDPDISWAHEALGNEFLNRARWAAINITILGASEDGCIRHQDGTFTCHEGCNEETESNDSCRYSDYLHQYTRPTNFAAVLCTLYPCIKYFTAEVQNGQMHEKVVWDIPLCWTSIIDPSYLWRGWQGIMQPCLVKDTIYTSANASSHPSKIPDPMSVVFHVEDWAAENPKTKSQFVNVTVPANCIAALPEGIVQSLKWEFKATYNATCTIFNTKNHGALSQMDCLQYGLDDAFSESHLATLLTNETTSVSTIDKAMDSIATRLTNEIRQSGKGPFGDPQLKVKGVVWETRACVRIRWEWLIFPGALLIMCAILLAAIMVTDAKKKHVWNSSILPFLLKDHPGIQSLSMKSVANVADGYEVKMETKTTA